MNNPPPPTRHEPPSNVASDFARSATFLGGMINQHVHRSVQSNLLHARNELSRGRPVSSLDNNAIMEQACLDIGMDMAESFSRDGPNSSWLNATTAAAGLPTTHTTLLDGRRFNTRNIPSCNRDHRENNNRLVRIVNQPNTTQGSRSSNLFPNQTETHHETRSNPAQRSTISPIDPQDTTSPARFDDSDLANAIENSLVQHGPSIANPPVPSNFANRDDILSPLAFQNSVIEGVGLKGCSEEDVYKIYNLRERTLKRSFQETEIMRVYNVESNTEETESARETATKRVNWIIDNEEKSVELIRLCLVADAEVSSPTINRTFDHFHQRE